MEPVKRNFRVIFSLICFFSSVALFAQSPEKMSYQAVVRNSGGVLLVNQNVGIRVQILQGSEFGAAVFVERHTTATNVNGLVTLEIGGGTPVLGTLAGINWSAGPYFLKTEIDPAGGTNYSIIGTTQLLSVPYALQAKSVTSEADPVFTASPASGITGSNITNWNSAFSWGNHAGLYRPATWLPSWANITAKPTEFPPSAHAHSAADITSGTFDAARIPLLDISTKTTGTLSAARGGTGLTSFTTGNYFRASGTTSLEQRTPAQVLTDIGAAAASHAHGNITSTGSIGSTAGRIVTTGANGSLQAMAGTATGQLLYWNGTEWVNVPPGNSGQVLTLVNGIPTWTGTSAGSTDVVSPATGKIWMDRNIGATQVATSSNDANSYGHLYQWGRTNDYHQLRTSGTTTTLSNVNVPSHGNFIIVNASPYDWRNPQNDNLWQGVSGLNNPCPTGYRLPTESEWNAERSSWSSSNAAGAFASPLKLPAAGYRDNREGLISLVGTSGMYWISTVSGTYSRSLLINSNNAVTGSNNRANGLSVRCLKD